MNKIVRNLQIYWLRRHFQFCRWPAAKGFLLLFCWSAFVPEKWVYQCCWILFSYPARRERFDVSGAKDLQPLFCKIGCHFLLFLGCHDLDFDGLGCIFVLHDTNFTMKMTREATFPNNLTSFPMWCYQGFLAVAHTACNLLMSILGLVVCGFLNLLITNCLFSWEDGHQAGGERKCPLLATQVEVPFIMPTHEILRGKLPHMLAKESISIIFW